jgi:hypothetical protein
MTLDGTLETQALRLTCLRDGDKVTGVALEVRQGQSWSRMATTSPLSHLIYKDKAGNRHEAVLTANKQEMNEAALKLNGDFVDVDGVTWRLSVTFSRTENPNQITADYRLDVDVPRDVLRWLGPSLHAGEGSFGSAKDEALFPGLEYLLDDEPSSDTRFAAPKYANRTVPHPYRISIPLMAVSHQGTAVGLLWDPNQDWGSAWRHPAALFSSPNRLQDSANNHWLALFAPGVEPRWLNEGETEAHKPYGIAPGKPTTLSARLVAVPSGGVVGILREWVSAYGLPPLPDPGHDYRQNIDLTIQSFLDVAWDEQAEGWHHTLADPWGPRFEPLLANQLWRYSRWPEGDPLLRARARDQVRRAIPRAVEKLPPPWHVPQLELSMVYGHVSGALDASADAARQAMTEQQADGSWGWTPAAVADIADFKNEERLAVMGKDKDSSTGFTSSKVQPVLKYALCTGNREAVDSVCRAADWCNAQRRPEGAQTWELHLHVPDVLAVPWLMNLNIGAYQLTGDERYLEAANRWAWTGLPFTFLWNGYYRPIMRYGTIPVFGVTFHDVQSWFGVIVHWNGLWYADALFRLAKYRRTDGPIDWYFLAEGITRHGMQEQATHGPYKGMYPDAFSTVRGDEEYTWWLNPQLIGLNTLSLAGLQITADPLIRDGVHITSGATIIRASRDAHGILSVLLGDQPGETSFTAIASSKRPTKIVCEGELLAESGEVDNADQGWQWLPAHNVALVKVRYGQGATTLRCHFES